MAILDAINGVQALKTLAATPQIDFVFLKMVFL
jgi:hypothetical protein